MGWDAIALVATFVLFWSGALLGAIKWLLTENQKHVDQRFLAMERALGERMGKLDSVQTELKDFKTYAEREFVRQEYWIRVEGSNSVRLRDVQDELHKLTEMLHAR